MNDRLFRDAGLSDKTTVPTISAGEFRNAVHAGYDIAILDVRLPSEYAYCRIPSARLIPLQELESRLGELSRSQMTVVYCHLGARSARAVQLLRAAGFDLVYNLHGGIDAWSLEVDPAVPRY